MYAVIIKNKTTGMEEVSRYFNTKRAANTWKKWIMNRSEHYALIKKQIKKEWVKI